MASTFPRLAVLALTLTAATKAGPELPTGSNATLDPIEFFAGRTRGEGRLDKALSRPVTLVVDGVGRRQEGTLILDQTIREGAKPPRLRRWVMRPDTPNRYTGTLSDAEGAVIVSVAGPRAHIRYRMRGGLQVDQQLALQADERTVINRLHVSKFGIRVASVEETIRKLD